ncbi:NDR1/HIN1-Like protein 3-like [Cucumis melo var. makuwa]|uniref:NDR1/HIN1-Like protein 3-like n=3 Tax=Cucumis melo TaxID=3656 RepID=A0A5D3DNY5_CUCMM|nr:NDR1/HIN1-Like protein 3-like [Cucumis melo var. makuwa]
MSRTKKFIIFSIIVIVLILISLFILWLMTMTRKLKFQVNNAKLTKFNLTNGSQLLFQLSLNMMVQNPNRGFGVFFDSIEVAVLYQDIKFSNMSLSPFYQGEEGKSLLNFRFDGQQLMNLDAEQLAVFTLEKLVDIFSIKVELRLHMRVKIGFIRIKLNPKVRCGLNLPLVSHGRSFLRFRIIGCFVAY